MGEMLAVAAGLCDLYDNRRKLKLISVRSGQVRSGTVEIIVLT